MGDRSLRVLSSRRVVLLLSIVCLASSALQCQGVNAQSSGGTECTKPRVRKSWDAFDQAEKDLFLNALSLAMQKGYQQKFVQLHVEWFSEKEAHQNCMFMYWHRLYLLGYENMLRSLGPQFICVTLPMWDHLAATARVVNGKICSNMEACAPIISDFGGSAGGITRSLKIENITVDAANGASCVGNGVLSNFCGNRTQSYECAQCVIRGPAYRAVYPGDALFGSVFNQVFRYSDWGSFRSAVEGGVHSTDSSVLL